MEENLPHTFSCSGWLIRYKIYNARPSLSTTSPPTIVFVHGTPWSSRVFSPIADAINASVGSPVLLYDLPGYGESQDREADASTETDLNGFVGDTSVRAQAVILSALLGHLKLDGRTSDHPPPLVIAHDIAGTIALRAHLLHQCQYSGLMLLDTNAILPWGDGFYKLARSSPQVFLQMPAHVYEAVVRAVIRSAIHCRTDEQCSAWEDKLAEPWLDPTGSSSQTRQRSFVRQIAQSNDADVAEMLDQNMYSKVQCPVKIMWGEKDEWIPRQKMEKLAQLLGHCLKGFVVVPRASHLLMIDQPEPVTAEIISWVVSRGQ